MKARFTFRRSRWVSFLKDKARARVLIIIDIFRQNLRWLGPVPKALPMGWGKEEYTDYAEVTEKMNKTRISSWWCNRIALDCEITRLKSHELLDLWLFRPTQRILIVFILKSVNLYDFEEIEKYRRQFLIKRIGDFCHRKVSVSHPFFLSISLINSPRNGYWFRKKKHEIEVFSRH